MFPIAYDHHGIIKSSMFFNDGLHVTNFRTGCVYNLNAAFLNFFPFIRSNTMSANNQNSVLAVLYLFDTLDRFNAAALEQFNCLRVMNQRTVSINRAACFMLRYIQHNIYGPANAHAKACCPGEFNFHFALGIPSALE